MLNNIEKLRYFIKQFAPISEIYGKKSATTYLKKSIDRTETHVVFCGEFKRGKSSLINAILKENICPTDIGIATAVVTRIMYGTTKKAFRYYNTGVDNMVKEEIAWEDIEKYTVGDIKAISGTAQMDLYCPSEFLKDGIVLIDTPGIGGLDPRHEILTKSALQSADVAVFITDAAEPVTQSEINFYQNNVVTNCKNNIILVNKADMITSENLQTHMEVTKNSLTSNKTKTKIIPVSAINWLFYNQFPNEDSMLASNMNEVSKAILELVNNFQKEHLIKLQESLISQIDVVIELIHTERDHLKEDNAVKDQTILGYQEKINELVIFRNDLTNPMSNIRLPINNIFENVRNEVLGYLAHESSVLTTKSFEELLNNEKALDDNGKWIVAQINDKMQDLVENIQKKMKEAFDKISKTLDRELSSQFVTMPPIISEELQTFDFLNSQLIFTLTGKVYQGMAIAFATSVGVEWFMPAALTSLIPGIGWLVGIATAAALIWDNLRQDNAQQQKAHIRRELIPKINLALTDMQTQTREQFTSFQQCMINIVQEKIQEAEDKLKSLRESVIQSRESNQQLTEKLQAVNQHEKFLNTLQAQCKLIFNNPFKQNG